MSFENEVAVDESLVGEVDQVEGDVLDTPSLALPKATPEIHEGTIESLVTKVGSQTGSSYGVINIKSKNTGRVYEFSFFPPQAWFDGANWGPRGFIADNLSDEPAPGKKQTPKEAFARSVSAESAAYTKEGAVITELVPGKDAPLQMLKKMAAIENLTLEPGTPRPTNGAEYIEVISKLVGGRLDVLFTQKPSKSDNPQFDGQLKVNAILPVSDLQKPNFDKRFADFRKMWE